MALNNFKGKVKKSDRYFDQYAIQKEKYRLSKLSEGDDLE
jgi:hypothetical protein